MTWVAGIERGITKGKTNLVLAHRGVIKKITVATNSLVKMSLKLTNMVIEKV